MKAKKPKVKSDNQVTGNIGLYYACYHLSKLGWNVMPTARNAKGVDVVAYNADASTKLTFQVKSLSKKNPVPLGKTMNNMFADFLLICVGVQARKPEVFVLNTSTAKLIATMSEKVVKSGEKTEKTMSFWIQPNAYYVDAYRDQWQVIGSGLVATTDSQVAEDSESEEWHE